MLTVVAPASMAALTTSAKYPSSVLEASSGENSTSSQRLFASDTARCNAEDIEKVHAAVKGADNHRIHVFVATSAIHREYKLKMAKDEIIKSAVGAVRLARARGAHHVCGLPTSSLVIQLIAALFLACG